jgi:hypothetical protein
MLWVNLIMDSFASLALATEDPNKSAPPSHLPRWACLFVYFRGVPLCPRHFVACAACVPPVPPVPAPPSRFALSPRLAAPLGLPLRRRPCVACTACAPYRLYRVYRLYRLYRLCCLGSVFPLRPLPSLAAPLGLSLRRCASRDPAAARGRSALLDRKPYPRDQAVLSQTMVRPALPGPIMLSSVYTGAGAGAGVVAGVSV